MHCNTCNVSVLQSYAFWLFTMWISDAGSTEPMLKQRQYAASSTFQTEFPKYQAFPIPIDFDFPVHECIFVYFHVNF